jgi:acylglycerol lipase
MQQALAGKYLTSAAEWWPLEAMASPKHMATAFMSVSTEQIKTIERERGYPLRYRIWRAKGSPIVTLVLMNGIMSHSGWFSELAPALISQRMNVVGADRRGSGLNQQEGDNAVSREVLLSDLRAIVDQEAGQLPVYLVGWCWGGVLAVNAALEFGRVIRGLVLLAPGLFPSTQIDRAMRERSSERCPGQKRPGLIRNPLTEEMFTDVPRFREFIRTDKLALRAFTPHFLAVTRNMLLVATARLSHLAIPVLLLLAAHDQTVDNKVTLERFQKLKTVDVTCTMLPHHHGLQFEAPQAVADNITRWVKRQDVPTPVSEDSL